MKHKLFITDEAKQEIQTEFDWYEEQLPGLGERLLLSIDEALDLIVDCPNGFPIRRKDYHECLIDGFPYLIIYRVADRKIIVHQLFHIKRRPGRKVK